MGFKPPALLLLLLLTSHLHIWKSVRGESSYIIDTVALTFLPGAEVQSGTKVMMHCKVTVSSSNISHLEHVFKFSLDGTEIHTTKTTKDYIDYEINPARLADSGNYECQVLVKDKRRTSNMRRLTVTGLQTPILHLNNSTPYEHEEFTLTCSAPEEKGSLLFNFYLTFQDKNPPLIRQRRSPTNSAEISLGLSHIGDCVLSCDYEISSVIGSTRSNSSNRIQVKIKELKIVPHMSIIPSDVYEPDLVEVNCKVQVHLPHIEIFLIKGRTVLKRVTGKTLVHRFRPTPTDSGELICKAEWKTVQRETYDNLIVKEVFSKPQLTLEPIDLFEGDTLTLNCSVEFLIPGMIDLKTFKYHLYKDGTELTSAFPYVTVAQPKHDGNYSCKAVGTRDAVDLSKESQTITVKAKVPVSDPVLSVVGGKMFLGKSFRLICHSDAGTFPIEYTLNEPNGNSIKRKVSRPQERAFFDISPIYKTSDLKMFLCHARNNPRSPPKVAQGQQLLKSTNIIEPVSKPELTVLPSTDITEGQSITLVCSVQTGSSPINFTWYHQESLGALGSRSTSKMRESYSIPNASATHEGQYYCVSTNLANELKMSEFVTIAVKIAGWKKALITVFCILLLLMFPLVIALKTRPLRFKRKRTSNLSVKSASTKTERLSLTQAEVMDANATLTMMGKSVWSDHISSSESDENNSTLPEKPEPQPYVQTTDVDTTQAPVKQDVETVYNEVRNSQQGVPEVPDGKPVEYAQLNRDCDHQADNSQVGYQSPNVENTTETENTDLHPGDLEEGTCDPAPDC